MKNEDLKFRTWVHMFGDTFLIAPLDLMDETTPNTSKFVTLAKVKKFNTYLYTSFVYGNPEYLPKLNNARTLTIEASSMDMAMFHVEAALENIYPLFVTEV